MKLERLLVCSLVLFFALACENQDDNTLEMARSCVDNAASISFTNQTQASSQAAGCDAMITNANLVTPEALKVRFGALMIEAGLMNQVATLAQAKNNKTTGVDGLAIMLSYLNINATLAATLNSVAIQANNPGMLYLAGIINMAVALQSVSAISGGNGASVVTALNPTTCTAACQTQVATAFTTFQSGACASPSDQASTDPANLCYKSKQITNGLPANATAAQIEAAIYAYAQTAH